MKVYKGKSIEEVIGLLGKYKDKGKVIAGGTDLIIDLRNGKFTPNSLIDISSIEELRRVEEWEESIKIGAATTFTQIIEDSLFDENLYGLKKACITVGSPQIRNKGTIGGNIANGSSAADSIPPLLCLDSTIVLESVRGKREISLENYYKDNLSIMKDEILTFIQFKKPYKDQVLSFAKLGLRKALAISRLSIATLLELDENGKVKTIKIATGSLGRFPMREPIVEEFLLGKELTVDVTDKAVEVLQQVMDERLGGRSTLPYKRIAVERIFKEALGHGVKRLKGVEPW